MTTDSPSSNSEDLTVTPLTEGTRVRIGPPSVAPAPSLLATLTDEIELQPDIGRVYLFEMTIGEQRPTLTLGFELRRTLQTAELRVLVERLAAVAQPILGIGETLQFVPLRDPSLLRKVRQAMGVREG